MAKFAFVFLAAFVFFQVNALIVKREATTPKGEKSAAETIDEAFQNLKSGFENFSKKVQENELFQNISQQLDTFGKQIQTEGKKLVEKIKGSEAKN